MAYIQQAGILSPDSNPITDSDLIMTAAVVGHAYKRLIKDENCRFDFEVATLEILTKEIITEKDKKELRDFEETLNGHHEALAKVNKALLNGGLPQSKAAQLGITPFYDKQTAKVVIGGTGNKLLTDKERHDPGIWTYKLSNELYKVAMGDKKDKNGKPILAGYQGRGAYTGFVAERASGQSSLMSTYRYRAPDNGRRWLPTEDAIKKFKHGLGAEIGLQDNQRKAWGIIVDNKVQEKVKEEGMYFQDEDTIRGNSAPLTNKDIAAYLHGLIQAIYDVEWHKALGERQPGIPYEIAAGTETTKLASCFTCSLFMEATGYPASSTHLGRGESWCISHHTSNDTQQQSKKNCNDKWAAYCQQIITEGMKCLVSGNKNLLKTADHRTSFEYLENYLIGKEQDPYSYANLILDAVTVHNSEFKRINAAICD